MKKIISIIMFALMLASFAFAEDTFTLSSTELLTAYSKNELAEDKKFKDKILIVTGKIDEVGKDLMGEVYVSFLTPSPFDRNFPKDLNLMISVQCYFEDTDGLENLSKGEGFQFRESVMA